jgi:DNA polymerase-3 subunit gamma/tau
VAWILLSNASVLSLEDNILTLRFARDGDLKGFTTSGCDSDLKRVLSSGFGLNVMIKGVVGGAPGDGGPGGGGPARPGSGPGSGSGPMARGPAAAAAPPPRGPAPDFAADYDEPPDDMPPDEDDLSLDAGPPAGHASGPPELTGMDLIQRELGGQVISEIDD